MTEQIAEVKVSVETRLAQIIVALDEKEMAKRRGFNFSAEYLQEKVAEAKEKYKSLNKFPDILVKGALLEIMHDELTTKFNI